LGESGSVKGNGAFPSSDPFDPEKLLRRNCFSGKDLLLLSEKCGKLEEQNFMIFQEPMTV
jgi:hypothetical protein